MSGQAWSTVKEAAWIEQFVRRHGRRPRVLHIGNIANNAYNNVKLLNAAGLDCDVICYDYYHIMGCPEWEDAEIEGRIDDQFNPDWSKVNLNGFQRPRWFAQGPRELCIRYLIARRRNLRRARLWWWLLNRMRPRGWFARWARRAVRFLRAARRVLRQPACISLSGMTAGVLVLLYPLTMAVVIIAGSALLLPVLQHRRTRSALAALLGAGRARWFNARVHELMREFAERFADREDQLSAEDLQGYEGVMASWQELFSHYDLVQAYATDPILPLLASKRPYVAYEHGTLRDFTLADDSTCRNTALAYNMADHVFITNGDCLEYAKKIHLRRFTPMLHPIDERKVRSAKGDYQGVHASMGAKYVFLCTLRHDWDVKGTDKYIRAIPKISERIGEDFRIIMAQWGEQVDQSKKLASELGVCRFIHWRQPLTRRELMAMLRSVDILFDQIALPHFGATAPEGIAAGLPVIMSYSPQSTEWIIPEPAPILPAWNEDQIAEQVAVAVRPEWLRTYRVKAREWIDKYHSSRHVLAKHLAVYRELLAERARLADPAGQPHTAGGHG